MSTGHSILKPTSLYWSSFFIFPSLTNYSPYLNNLNPYYSSLEALLWYYIILFFSSKFSFGWYLTKFLKFKGSFSSLTLMYNSRLKAESGSTSYLVIWFLYVSIRFVMYFSQLKPSWVLSSFLFFCFFCKFYFCFNYVSKNFFFACIFSINWVSNLALSIIFYSLIFFSFSFSTFSKIFL